jgi:hypothetical protein
MRTLTKVEEDIPVRRDILPTGMISFGVRLDRAVTALVDAGMYG